MCGIMGYVGPQQAAPILLDGLRRLEYRGYDSAGVAVTNGKINVRKAEGKIDRLADLLDRQPLEGSIGIGHTRWATHGEPSDVNAHPHTDPSGEFVVVHNGIIENFQSLREELEGEGRVFTSDTDSEILAHLVAREYQGDLEAAIRSAVAKAEGAYALVVMTKKEPGKIVAVRRISPLIVGLGEGETFLASDIPAVLHRTRNFMIVEDGEMVIVTKDGARIETIAGDPVSRDVMHIDWDAEQAEKGGFDHFMLKEIHEQPSVVTETLAGRLDESGQVWLEDVKFDDDFARGFDEVWITACGTAYHAGLVGKEIFRRLLRVPTTVEYAHEMRYNDPLISSRSLTVAISQSGETADTLAAARLAKERGSRLLSLTNVVGSTLSREADDILYTRAGPEISVASTKAYLAMLIAQYLLALRIGRARGVVDEDLAARVAHGLSLLPGQIEQILRREDEVVAAAEEILDAEDVYFIGRGLDYAVAMEGSLKLKEISYLHSEAMPAGELKHGTLALITKGTPVIVVLTQQALYEKTISAVQEVKARGGKVLAVAYDDDEQIHKFAHSVLRIPRADDLLGPVAAVVPLQLLAYHVALLRGHDIDQPRNLAKSVTVE
ncbi:MAG: glutamine--fructose-6-phosphate transaminase (isomerizing) [Acidimicrobiia bacterium]|nr:glutamine--fructose-6-phosphate transaminase (isomerizing) [Acidimicrobiia bacterium]MDX2465756.1 glutamine--fructose-6-phosphate transaminase (isomerizing) [Acidimicrobiia bacterium]